MQPKKITDTGHFNSDLNMPIQYLDSVIVQDKEKPPITCWRTDTGKYK
jgi:hypothetical protein